jgi:CheY-like chemotaxis protein
MSDLASILLVEDSQDDYEAAMRSLRDGEFTHPIRWCRSGQDALDYLYRKGAYAQDATVTKPELILLDLNMPGIDGRQVLKTVKADAALRSIPVIILTTSADNKDVEHCYNNGASTYIQKPVNFDELTRALRAVKNYWFGIALLPGREKKRVAR